MYKIISLLKARNCFSPFYNSRYLPFSRHEPSVKQYLTGSTQYLSIFLNGMMSATTEQEVFVSSILFEMDIQDRTCTNVSKRYVTYNL